MALEGFENLLLTLLLDDVVVDIRQNAAALHNLHSQLIFFFFLSSTRITSVSLFFVQTCSALPPLLAFPLLLLPPPLLALPEPFQLTSVLEAPGGGGGAYEGGTMEDIYQRMCLVQSVTL